MVPKGRMAFTKNEYRGAQMVPENQHGRIKDGTTIIGRSYTLTNGKTFFETIYYMMILILQYRHFHGYMLHYLTKDVRKCLIQARFSESLRG